MRKVSFLLALLLILSFLSACGDSDGVVEIRERFFVNQFQDIVTNHEEYLGRTIRYEGAFETFPQDGGGEDVYFVYRVVPTCCSPGGSIGFLLDLGEFAPLADDAWVEVTGVLELFEFRGFPNLRLVVTSLVELDERGELMVQP